MRIESPCIRVDYSDMLARTLPRWAGALLQKLFALPDCLTQDQLRAHHHIDPPNTR